jgi:hypothetical protein
MINFKTAMSLLKLLQEKCTGFHFSFPFVFIGSFCVSILLCLCLLQVRSSLGELYQVGDRGQKIAECDKPV